MASALYASYKESCLDGSSPDLSSATVKVTAVDGADYTPDLATHDFIADIASGARIATATLSNVSVTGGVLDADDTTLASVTGDEFEYLVIWVDTGSEATSPLIALIDTGTGLPFTPNGGNIQIVWDNDAEKIFAL